MAGPDFDVLLLDFGGVCLVNPVELHARVESTLGLDPGTFDWMGPVDPSTDPLWQEMVSGAGLSERDYWSRRANDVGRAAGQDLSLRDYMKMLYEPPVPEMVRPDATKVVKAALDSGYGVSLLTNDMRAFHGTEWENDVPFLQLMDHIADCSDTGILKPDPRAFQRATDIIGVEPDRVLFVDDQPLNVAGADAFGMHGYWFDISNASGAWMGVAERLGLSL